MRQSKRVAVNEAVRLHPNSWSNLEIVVLDCSDSGFRAHCEAKVTPGLGVTIELPGIGPTAATVTWRRGSQFGARFAEPIDLAKVGFNQLRGQALLARLLVQRVAAHEAGLLQHEAGLRRHIAQALPMKRIVSRRAP